MGFGAGLSSRATDPTCTKSASLVTDWPSAPVSDRGSMTLNPVSHASTSMRCVLRNPASSSGEAMLSMGPACRISQPCGRESPALHAGHSHVCPPVNGSSDSRVRVRVSPMPTLSRSATTDSDAWGSRGPARANPRPRRNQRKSATAIEELHQGLDIRLVGVKDGVVDARSLHVRFEVALVFA